MGEATPEPEWPAILRSPELKEKIKTAKVLCVGAGGIGCELLKTLVCTGFKNLEVIDLDTIETSNLNRQFLFRRHHVGQSKADTAATVIKSIKPDASITAHHANIKELRFGVDYIRGFQLVLNGLDNLEARRHVNRLAMAADVPLLESGTEGYKGQVTVHLKGETECYECTPKPTPKTFPVCTIRNTPDKPIHCVVWSKEMLFNRLFGNPATLSDLDEPTKTEGDDAAAAEAAAAAAAEAEQASEFIRKEGETPLAYALRMFDRLFNLNIQQVLIMEELWKSRTPPTPLSLSTLFPEAEWEQVLGLQAVTPPHVVPSKALGLPANQEWSTADTARVFLRSIIHYHTHRQDELGKAVFDKDDDLAVDFVTSASNLRSACYAIPPQTLFAAKGMAGNIIHAIATTNAIISGLIVVEALKLLAGCRSSVRSSYLHAEPSAKRLVVPNSSDPPRPGCMVCGQAVLTLQCNTQQLSLKQLVEQVLKKRLAMVTPMIMAGDFLYEEGEGVEEDEVERNQRMLGVALSSLPGGGLCHGTMFHATDEAQAFEVNINIVHQDAFDEESCPEGWMLLGSAPAPTATPAAPVQPKEVEADKQVAPRAAAAAFTETADGQLNILSDDDDDVVIMSDAPVAGSAEAAGGGAKVAGSKRGRDEGEEQEQVGRKQAKDDKRACVQSVADDDVVCID